MIVTYVQKPKGPIFYFTACKNQVKDYEKLIKIKTIKKNIVWL